MPNTSEEAGMFIGVLLRSLEVGVSSSGPGAQAVPKGMCRMKWGRVPAQAVSAEYQVLLIPEPHCVFPGPDFKTHLVAEPLLASFWV